MTSETDKLSGLLDSINSEEEWLAYGESLPLTPIDPNDDVPWDYDTKIF